MQPVRSILIPPQAALPSSAPPHHQRSTAGQHVITSTPRRGDLRIIFQEPCLVPIHHRNLLPFLLVMEKVLELDSTGSGLTSYSHWLSCCSKGLPLTSLVSYLSSPTPPLPSRQPPKPHPSSLLTVLLKALIAGLERLQLP